MSIRTAAIVIGLLDAAVWVVLAFMTLLSGSDPATKGLDIGAGAIVTALFLATSAPALVLAWVGRAPRTALVLALAFPVAFVLLFVAVVIAFA
jgi:hypothetical protein